MNKYKVTVKHDKGTVNIITAADSEQGAREIVMNAEGCPPAAIEKVSIHIEPKIRGYSSAGYRTVKENDQREEWLKSELHRLQMRLIYCKDFRPERVPQIEEEIEKVKYELDFYNEGDPHIPQHLS